MQTLSQRGVPGNLHRFNYKKYLIVFMNAFQTNTNPFYPVGVGIY